MLLRSFKAHRLAPLPKWATMTRPLANFRSDLGQNRGDVLVECRESHIAAGLSYEYVASVLPEVAPEIARGRVIIAHLGSGASLCALKDGKSVDTSLGFTALDGLCMGTRPGALDPGVVLYLFQSLGLSPKEVETILYKKSGLLGISGISNDMRDLLTRSAPEARLAVDYFVYRAAKEIGALAAVLGGVDGLVFTAGIGENSPEIRRRICEASSWLGVELDARANIIEIREYPLSKAKSRLGDSHERGTHDRTPHRRASWIDREPPALEAAGSCINREYGELQMAIAIEHPITSEEVISPWQGFRDWSLAKGD